MAIISIMEKNNIIQTCTRILFLCFVFFLPFHYALTFKFGFNIKISEVCILALILLLHKEIYSKILNLNFTEKCLGIFVIWATISFIVNQFYHFTYPLSSVPQRFNAFYDSLSKLAYLIFIFVSFLISNILNSHYKNEAIRYFETGIILACLYTWYLSVVSIQEFSPYLLPGMDSFPQHSLLSFGHFIRSGTFKEGNHMGLILLVGFFIGLKHKRWLLMLACLTTILPTVSTMAIVCLLIVMALKIANVIYINKHYRWIIIPVIFLFLSMGYLLNKNEDIQLLVVQKIFPEKENTDYSKDWGAFSKAQRINYIKVAWNIFKDNPIFGVGISNYGLHFNHYNKFPETKYQKIKPYKPIVNNVYLEILSEQGLVGLLIFILFLGTIFIHQQSKNNRNIEMIGILIYFIAYPSFTLLFIYWYFSQNTFIQPISKTRLLA